MKLKELNTTLENQRTICYKKDGNSITYHNKGYAACGRLSVLWRARGRKSVE